MTQKLERLIIERDEAVANLANLESHVSEFKKLESLKANLMKRSKDGVIHSCFRIGQSNRFLPKGTIYFKTLNHGESGYAWFWGNDAIRVGQHGSLSYLPDSQTIDDDIFEEISPEEYNSVIDGITTMITKLKV
jgi:hypothetical protein